MILAGPGIHTGAPCRLELRRRSEGAPGIRFLFGGHAFSIGDLAGLPRSARRATVLGKGETLLHTPEHLLAALLFFRHEPLDILCEGGEVPNLDGSALPFREALAGLCSAKGPAPAWEEYPCDLAFEHAWDGGHLRTRPARRFAVTWILERDGLAETVRVESPVEAWEMVLPARTWIFHRDWMTAREAGLLKGGHTDAGLLLAASAGEHAALREAHPEWKGGTHPLLNQPEWRLDREPARHKVLDLLGDLALKDLRLPSLEIEVRNGGHACNHLLLEKLIHG